MKQIEANPKITVIDEDGLFDLIRNSSAQKVPLDQQKKATLTPQKHPV